jgi:hypothetical protein
VQASRIAVKPAAREDSNYLGTPKITAAQSAVSRIDANVLSDNLTPLGISGYESDMVIAICQGAISTVQVGEEDFDGNVRLRPRQTISVKGISARDGTATGPTTNLVTPSTASMASLAVILDASGMPVAKNYRFRMTRVRNSTGGTLTAGTAVIYLSNVDGLVNIGVSTGAASDRFVGVLAEDIPTLETGACYSGQGALVPRTIAVASAAANEGPCFSAASGAMAATGSQKIGTWKHLGGAGAASILQLTYIF